MGQRIYGTDDAKFVDLKNNNKRLSLNDAIEIIQKEQLGPVKIFERFNCTSLTTTEDISAVFKASNKYMVLIGQSEELKKLRDKLETATNEKTAAETQLTELQKKIQEAEEAAAKAKKATKPKDPKKDPEIKVLIADAVSAARAEDAEALNRAQDDLLATQDKLSRAEAEVRRLTRAYELAEQRAKDAEAAAEAQPVVAQPPKAEPAKQEAKPVADAENTPYITAEISNGVTIGLIQAIGDEPITPAEEKALRKFAKLKKGDITRRPYVKMNDEIVQIDSLDVNEIVKALRDKPV